MLDVTKAFCMFLDFSFLYLRSREKQRQKERTYRESHPLSSHPGRLTIARARLSWSWGPEIQYRLLCWWLELNYRSHHHCLPMPSSVGSWNENWSQLWTTATLLWDAGVPTHVLSTRSSHHPLVKLLSSSTIHNKFELS